MNMEFRLRISEEHQSVMSDALKLDKDERIELNKDEIEILRFNGENITVRIFGEHLANPKISEGHYRYSGVCTGGKETIKDLEEKLSKSSFIRRTIEESKVEKNYKGQIWTKEISV